MTEDSGTRVLIVIGHGRSGTLCHHLAEVARDALVEGGATCRVHDLLADGFDPVLRLGEGVAHAEELTAEQDPLVHRYQQDLRWAQSLVIVHPIWWFSPPAILKGWVDRVLAEGVALDHASEPPRGLLHDRRALLVQTFKAAGVVDAVLTRGVSGAFWRRAVFMPLGVKLEARLALHGAGKLDDARLEAFERRLRRATAKLLRCAD